MGISSCDCPAPGEEIVIPGHDDIVYVGFDWSEKTDEEVKEDKEDFKDLNNELMAQGEKDMARGQTFILSLNALAGENDSYTYTDAKGNKRTISGIDEAEYAANKIYKLNSTIEANLKKFAPGGIYISAENLKALAIDVGVSGPVQNALKPHLKELITLLKRMGHNINATTKKEDLRAIEPLIVTQEGGQFQRLLTAEIVGGQWKKSDLGKQLGLEGLGNYAGKHTAGKKKNPDDGTPYSWGTAIAGALDPSPGETVNAVGRQIGQVYDLGFSLNYWLVGGTLRGPDQHAFGDPTGLSRVQTSANVLGYKAVRFEKAQEMFPKVTKNWRKGNTVTHMGDFPGKPFTEIVKKSPKLSESRLFGEEIDWDSLERRQWVYFKEHAAAAMSEPISVHVKEDSRTAASRLYYYARAIKGGIDIISLSQDPLYELTDYPWKSRELISVLRNEMEFGEKGVVMVGDPSALIRDEHPEWLYGNDYAGIGREMSTVIQLNADDVTESLLADADLFHLWRIDAKTITYGPYTNKVKLERESALDTVQKIFDKIKNNSDPDLEKRLKEARGRIMDMKLRTYFRVPGRKAPPPPSGPSTTPPPSGP